jgi:hypothetical protein
MTGRRLLRAIDTVLKARSVECSQVVLPFRGVFQAVEHTLKGGTVTSEKWRFAPSPPFSFSSTALHSNVHVYQANSPLEYFGIIHVSSLLTSLCPDQSLPHRILICPALTSSPPGPLISSQSFALALFPVQPAIKASLALALSAFSLIQIGSLGSLVSMDEKSLDFGLNILDHILCFLSNGRDGPKVG